MRFWKLAIKNIQKYWRHYGIILLLVSGTIGGMLGYLLVNETKVNSLEHYEIEHYGSWFVSIEKDRLDELLAMPIQRFDVMINDTYPTTLEEIWKERTTLSDNYHHTVIYRNGLYDNDLVGYIPEADYDLFALHVLEGKTAPGDGEVLISTTYQESHLLKMGDTLHLDVDGSHDYQIVGIFENHNDTLPVIMTNLQTGTPVYYANNTVARYEYTTQAYCLPYAASQVAMSYVPVDYEVNPNGVDANKENSSISKGIKDIALYMEVVVMLAIVVAVLTATSAKRRGKEYALLRGIGATTGQLMNMVTKENVIIVFLATLIGCSGGYGYLMMYAKNHSYLYGGTYLMDFDVTRAVIYVLSLDFVTCLVALLPVRSNAQSALSGAFEGGEEPLIRIRQRKRLRQTPYRLAQRQLETYSRLAWIFTVLVLGASVFASVYMVQDMENAGERGIVYAAYSRDFESEEEYQTFVSLLPDDANTHVEPYFWTDNKMIAPYDAMYISRGGIFEGRLLENPNEVIIPSTVEKVTLFTFEDHPNMYTSTLEEFGLPEALYVDGIEYRNYFTYSIDGEVVGYNVREDYQLGETVHIEINGVSHDFEIVGIVSPSYEVKYYDESSSVEIQKLSRRNYNRFYGRGQLQFRNLYFIDESVFNEYANTGVEMMYLSHTIIKNDDVALLKNKLQTTFDWPYAEDYEFIGAGQARTSQGAYLDLTQFSPAMFIVPVIIGMVVCFFLTLNTMLNTIKDYALFNLIGMTKGSLLERQFWMAFIMSLRSYIFFGCYYMMLIIGFSKMLQPLQLLGGALVIFAFYLIVYCVPMIYILNTDLLENYMSQE